MFICAAFEGGNLFCLARSLCRLWRMPKLHYRQQEYLHGSSCCFRIGWWLRPRPHGSTPPSFWTGPCPLGPMKAINHRGLDKGMPRCCMRGCKFKERRISCPSIVDGCHRLGHTPLLYICIPYFYSSFMLSNPELKIFSSCSMKTVISKTKRQAFISSSYIESYSKIPRTPEFNVMTAPA